MQNTKVKRKIVMLGVILLLVLNPIFVTKAVNFERVINPIEQNDENWWNTDFIYRKLITINHSLADNSLKNFPILIYRENDDNLSSHAQDDGDDICFIDYEDNSTKLNHEIECYDSGTLWAWVNVTSLHASIDTKIWMYYGNETCESQENIVDVWDSHYVVVQHLNETDITVNDHFTDSTAFVNHGTLVDSDGDSSSVAGKISNAFNFSSDYDYIKIKDDNELDIPHDITFEAWVKKSEFVDWDCISFKCDPVDQKPMNWQFGAAAAPSHGSNKALALDYSRDDGDEWNTHWIDNVFCLNSWQWVAINYDGSDVHFFENGSMISTQEETNDMDTHDFDIYIGSLPDGNGFVGVIDELRISDISRNVSWLAATYRTTNNPSQYVLFGDEQKCNRPPYSPHDPYPESGSTNVNLYVDLHWVGGDPDEDNVTYNVYFGDTSNPPLVSENQTSTVYDPGVLVVEKTYYWMIVCYDVFGKCTYGDLWWFSTGDNQPPFKPVIVQSEDYGKTDYELEFSAVAIDPEDDDIYYQWQWGDGSTSDWLGPLNSGKTVTSEHEWEEVGSYLISVKAKDENGAEGYLSDPVELVIEDTPPVVEFEKPVVGSIYYWNEFIIPFFVTLVIGPIDVLANATDDISGIDRIEFCVDGVQRHIDYSSPYMWGWYGMSIIPRKFELQVITYDQAGNYATCNNTLVKFL